MAKITFTEGALAKALADTGWPSTVRACLSTKPCSGAGAHTAGEQLANNDFGEAIWTGSARQDSAEPAGSTPAGTKVWPTFVFATNTATDGPSAVKSIVFMDPATSKLLEAVDLSAVRDMSGANTTINYVLTTTSAIA